MQANVTVLHFIHWRTISLPDIKYSDCF